MQYVTLNGKWLVNNELRRKWLWLHLKYQSGFSWSDWEKPQNASFRIASLWVKGGPKSSRIESMSATHSAMILYSTKENDTSSDYIVILMLYELTSFMTCHSCQMMLSMWKSLEQRQRCVSSNGPNRIGFMLLPDDTGRTSFCNMSLACSMI
jgi:hypothetical protein